MGNRLYEYFNKCITDNKKPTYDDFIGLNESYNFLTRDLFEVCYTYKCTDDIISLNEYQKISVFEQNSEMIESSNSYNLENTQTLSEMLDSFGNELFEDEGGINDLIGSMTKSAGIIAGLGATAIGGTGWAIFSGIRNLFRAKKVKKMQLQINEIKIKNVVKEIEIAKNKYKTENDEKASPEDKKKSKEDAKKGRESLTREKEAADDQVENIRTELDTLVGSSNYLKRIRSKYKAEGDNAIYQLKIKNAEFLGIEDEELNELKEKQKEAAQRSAELEKELTQETSELKKKADEEGGEEAAKKTRPILLKIRALDGRIINVKKEIEDLGGEIEKEAAAAKQRKKSTKAEKEAQRQEAKAKKEDDDDDTGNKGSSVVKTAIDNIRSRFEDNSIEIDDDTQINEGAKEKLQELQRTLWSLVLDRQELVIKLLEVTNKDGKNDEQLKSAQTKLEDITQKLEEFGGKIDASNSSEDDEIAAAEEKVKRAKEKVDRMEKYMQSADDKNKAKAIENHEAALEELTDAEDELKMLKKSKSGKKETTTKEPAKPTTKTEPRENEIDQTALETEEEKLKDAERALNGATEAAKDATPETEVKLKKDVADAQMKVDTIKANIEKIKKGKKPDDSAQAGQSSSDTEKKTDFEKEKDTLTKQGFKEGEPSEDDAKDAEIKTLKDADGNDVKFWKKKETEANKTQSKTDANADKKKALDDEIARLEKKMEGAMSAIDKAPENKKAEIEKRFDELGAQIKSLKKKKEELGESANIETLLSEVNKISYELDKMVEDINNPNAQTYQTIDERIKNMRNILLSSESLKKLYNK